MIVVSLPSFTSPNVLMILTFSFQDDYADLPTEDEAVTCGKFEVHLESLNVMKNCTIRKLRLFSSVSMVCKQGRSERWGVWGYDKFGTRC